MEYKSLGRSGLQVSAVGLGCMNFGMMNDQAQATAIVNRALELGVNFFDTADVYGNRGKSEEYLGKAQVITRKAAEFTRQMLAYSGKGRFEVKPLDLSRVVEEMGHLLSISIYREQKHFSCQSGFLDTGPGRHPWALRPLAISQLRRSSNPHSIADQLIHPPALR